MEPEPEIPRMHSGQKQSLFAGFALYIAVLLIILGQAVITHSADFALYGLGIAIMFFLIVIFYEEPVLMNKFGDEYVDYCARVPRCIPRLFQGRHS